MNQFPDTTAHELHVPTSIAHSLGVDPATVRWHGGPATSRALRERGLVAAARGRTVHLDDALASSGRLSTRSVIAHELVHVLQQSEGARWIRSGDTPAELEEEAAVLGRLACLGRRLPPRRRNGPVLHSRVQGHDSFEHRMLGDTPTNLLAALVAGQGSQGNRDTGLASACALLDYLGSNAQSVDASKLSQLAGFPVRAVTLRGSGLTVTYGELNMMADYLTTPEEVDTLSVDILLPILQMTRYSGWTRLNAMRTSPASGPDFHSWLNEFVPGSVQSVVETLEFDSLTKGLGVGGRDHYNGVLARNACHFAPYSWWRWKASYNVAVAAAQDAYRGGGADELVRKAWVAHGYADHFLQDSFAAGHLVNKSLVMQWFLEWAAGTSIPVYNWSTFSSLTAANQPGLTGMALYDTSYPGLGTDPQTTEEQPTMPQRIANSGVVAAAGLSQEQAYMAYLAMLDSPVVQIVTNQLHDVLNGRSVTASSSKESNFQIWGDDTMLKGGTGAGFASAAAQRSQQSIQDILSRGGTDTTWQDVFALFPDQILSKGSFVTLKDWHAPGGELWDLCRSNEVFNSNETTAFGAGSYFMPDMGNVSVDQPTSRLPGGNIPFSNADCGKVRGQAVSEAGCLKPGDQVMINGSTDLSSCIVGNSGGRVFSIKLAKQAPILYDYVITVEAAGPKGIGSGWLNLWFTDRTGDRYALGIWKSDRLAHTVAYNSADPGIVKIEWSD